MCLRACRQNAVDFSPFRPYRYAHRGLHNLQAGIPENTLPAFQAAADRAFGVELDVHLTADGRLAVIHDGNLLRLCGVDRAVCAMTAAELLPLQVCGTAQHIPFLEDVLPILSGRVPVLIELKTDGGNAAALTRAAAVLLDRFSGDFCLESFDPRVLLFLRRHRPDLCRGQLSRRFSRSGGGIPNPLRFFLSKLLTNFLTRPDFIAYRLEDRGEPAVALCRQKYGVPEFSWTIRSEQELRAAEQAGCIPIFEGFLPKSSGAAR